MRYINFFGNILTIYFIFSCIKIKVIEFGYLYGITNNILFIFIIQTVIERNSFINLSINI